MQSYFRSLSDANGGLALLEDTQVGDGVGSFSQISLQNSTSSPNAEEQANISLQNQQDSFADDEDLFICGRCKQQFTDIQIFFHHKRVCIIRPRSMQNQDQSLPMMQIQQLSTEHLRQEEQIDSIPNAAVLITGGQNLGQQSHTLMLNVNAERCSTQRLENSTGLNLTQDSRKDRNLCSSALRNTMGNITLMSTDQQSHLGINQVENLVQFQSNDVNILQENMNFTTRNAENSVISEDILMSSSSAQTDFSSDEQINRLQQNEVNQHQLSALGINMVSNNSMASLLQQINPIQQQTNYSNTQQQVYLHISPQSQLETQKNYSLQSRELSNATIGLNLSAINLTPLTVTTIQDDQLQNSLVVQNLSKQTPILARPENIVTQQQQQISTLEIERSESVEIKQKSKRFTCQFCSKAFTRGFDLDQHVRSHTGEKPFQCIVCGRAFSQKSNVKKHMATHKVWPKKATDIFPQLVIVEKDDDDDDDANTDRQLEVTVMEVATPKTVIPEECEDTYHCVSSATELSCPYCDQVLDSYKERKSHMLRHKDKQVYKCVKDGCNKTYEDLAYYVEHVKEHTGAMTYKCHHCHKLFDTLHNLGVHQYQAHLNDKSQAATFPPTYACALCPKKFSQQEFLQIHMKNESHNHPCLFCLKRFSCERYLRRHVTTAHSQSRQEKVKCDICGTELKSIYYLRSHMLIHTKEKPFKCDQCKSAFNRRDKLKRHMSIHDPIKKYKCPLRESLGCMKEFNRRDKLKAHIICHSGLRPHKCSYCPKRYTRKCFKVAHERTHTGEFQCKKCLVSCQTEKKLEEHKCKLVDSSRLSTKSKRNRKKKSEDISCIKGAVLTEAGVLPRNLVPLPEGPMYAIRSGSKRPFLKRRRKPTKKALLNSEKISVEIELPNVGAEEFSTEDDSDVEVDVEADEDVQ